MVMSGRAGVPERESVDVGGIDPEKIADPLDAFRFRIVNDAIGLADGF